MVVRSPIIRKGLGRHSRGPPNVLQHRRNLWFFFGGGRDVLFPRANRASRSAGTLDEKPDPPLDPESLE